MILDDDKLRVKQIYNKIIYQRYKETYKRLAKKYALDNKVKIKEYQKEYADKNKEKRKQYFKDYYINVRKGKYDLQ